MLKLYSIRDVTADSYGAPFEAVNDGIALRRFEVMLKDVPVEYQGEFELWYICEFDESAMELMDGAKRQVVVAMDDEQLEAASGE